MNNPYNLESLSAFGLEVGYKKRIERKSNNEATKGVVDMKYNKKATKGVVDNEIKRSNRTDNKRNDVSPQSWKSNVDKMIPKSLGRKRDKLVTNQGSSTNFGSMNVKTLWV